MNEYTINIPLNHYEELKRCELKCNEFYMKKVFSLAYYLSQNGVSRDYDDHGEFVKKSNELINLLNSKYFEILEIGK